MNNIDMDKIPSGALNIIHELNNNGYEAYLVGGCVRDLLMGHEPNDFDITTSATPDEMKRSISYKSYDTGIKHGTVTFADSNREMFEVTVFRRDGEYSDGRHPDKIEFSSSLEEDLARRDFTINAIAWSPDRGIVDPYNGTKDIESKLIRCVDDPNKRFKEDGLRIARAMRFSATKGFEIEASTFKAMNDNVDVLDNVSRERVKNELFKTLSAEDGQHMKSVLYKNREVLYKACGSLQDEERYDQNNHYHNRDLLDHSLETAANVHNDPVLRLAALLHDTGKLETATIDDNGESHYYEHALHSRNIAITEAGNLKLSNDEKKRLLFLIENHDRRPSSSLKSVRRFINKCKNKNLALDTLELMQADVIAQHPDYRDERLAELDDIREKLIAEYESGNADALDRLEINGSDLIDMGYKPGKELGDILKDIKQQVVDGDLSNDRSTLISYIDHLKDGDIWVRPHIRNGRDVKGFFRKRRN